MFFCSHKWVEKERFYRPDTFFGYKYNRTIILYECRLCGEMKKVKINGEPSKNK